MQEEHRASDSGGVVPQEDVLLRREQGRDEDAQPRRQAGMVLEHINRNYLKITKVSFRIH